MSGIGERFVPLVVAALLCVGTFAGPATAAPTVREYWIAADEIDWDYAPSGMDSTMGMEFSPEQLVFVGNSQQVGVPVIGRVVRKAVYQSYSANFASVIDGASVRDGRSNTPTAHLGLLGPIIRAEVGDRIIVHFQNHLSFPTSVHPHGVFYNARSEGAPYANAGVDNDEVNSAPRDDEVPPGGSHTYRWAVPARSGPGPADPSSVVWMYHGHTDEPGDTNAGLIGAIAIYREETLLPNGLPKGIDKEFFTLFTIFDENASSMFAENVERAGIDVDNHPDEELFEESNLKHSMNGLLFGNNRGYTMKKGDRVRWHVMSMGTEVDLHTPHWHGVTLLLHGSRVDVTQVFPATTQTLDLRADNPGTWMYHCHVNDHITAGMMTKFTIEE